MISYTKGGRVHEIFAVTINSMLMIFTNSTKLGATGHTRENRGIIQKDLEGSENQKDNRKPGFG